MKLLHALALGIKRHPLKFAGEIFLAYSAIWTIIDSTLYFFSETDLHGWRCYLALLLISIAIACVRAYPRRSVDFKVGHSNTKISVFFGDIFKQDGHLAIPVNEYFDSQLGLPVSPNSLHGMVINRFFGGHSAAFDQLISADLSGAPYQLIQRTGGKTNKFPIGTTASIRANSHRFLLFALCKTDIATFKASASLPDLVEALEGLCAKARNILNGEKLVVPLIGSGLSGIGLPANQLLQIILLVLVNETKRNQFAIKIDIVIHPDRFDEIDLDLIETHWS
jgi:hypothetical protein